jgi:hypothetical protein
VSAFFIAVLSKKLSIWIPKGEDFISFNIIKFSNHASIFHIIFEFIFMWIYLADWNFLLYKSHIVFINQRRNRLLLPYFKEYNFIRRKLAYMDYFTYLCVRIKNDKDYE